MRIATLSIEGSETAGIVTDTGVFTINAINDAFGGSWPADVFQLLQAGQLQELTGWYNKEGRALLLGLPHLAVPAGEARYAPLFRNPGKIWGIGLNYREHARDLNVISNMTFPPDYLVSFHSTVMTLLPGDVICTGTPGAAVLREGDTLACRIDGFPCLENRVQDLKSF